MSHKTGTGSRETINLAYEMNDDPPITPLRSVHDEPGAVRFIVRDYCPWQPDLQWPFMYQSVTVRYGRMMRLVFYFGAMSYKLKLFSSLAELTDSNSASAFYHGSLFIAFPFGFCSFFALISFALTCVVSGKE